MSRPAKPETCQSGTRRGRRCGHKPSKLFAPYPDDWLYPAGQWLCGVHFREMSAIRARDEGKPPGTDYEAKDDP